jgi:WD40 repeat protein
LGGLGGHSPDGKNGQALAQLAQALRLNPENREASALTAAMLTQLNWHVPLTGSILHKDVVYSAQFSPDGQRIVTASWNNTARLWAMTIFPAIPLTVVNFAYARVGNEKISQSSTTGARLITNVATVGSTGRCLLKLRVSCSYASEDSNKLTILSKLSVNFWCSVSA